MFDRMRAAGDLRLEGAPAFHMKANFHSEDGSAKGTYEETWISPEKWRREVKLNDTTVLEVRTRSGLQVWPTLGTYIANKGPGGTTARRYSSEFGSRLRSVNRAPCYGQGCCWR
jgi:hypothetical protein